MKSISEWLEGNPYPGRGILVGESVDGNYAYLAYFIMGRSENSRNRIFAEQDGSLYTRPFDESKVVDPSLIIYPAMRTLGQEVILTNGDQTDTIFDALKEGGDFFSALEKRTFEPDAPNYTPRISALVTLGGGALAYKMSILRREKDGVCERAKYRYDGQAGVGHLIHTYITDGNPLPSFTGAPKEVKLECDFSSFASSLWAALDEANKISLFVRAIDLATGEIQTKLFNKHTRSEA